jgi:hypothetical protein
MSAAGGCIVKRLVKVGGESKQQLLSQLTDAGVNLNEYARALFLSDKFTTSPASQQLVAIEAAVRYFGFTRGATMAELHDKARAFGLIPPSLEMAPHLRLQYLDQPEGCWGHPVTEHRAPPGSITIASAPLSDDDEFPKGFYLRRIKGALWLRGYRCGTENVWNPDDRLVFCQP